ncbi:MAG: LLM class flavin-dependent oxidoreductase [Acidimicrobiales bacterium]|jgi:alkanesulfonate monooxygenase SsuD/methylene tetrahydromethanopterin reductase-like flavin-dependent oxidoreductase (luciferase family)
MHTTPDKAAAIFTMRFAMRSETTDPSGRADLYRSALDMCAWAETRGCVTAIVSQHHGVDDGYLPSPVPLAAAIAARTTTLPVTVAALLLALYEPVKLAEDLAVVDLLSRGRVSYVIGIGYRDEEFAMFGVDRRTRAQTVEERISLLRRLWSGDRVDVDGRPVTVTPLPFTPGGPMLAYGGGTEAAARRAGRLGMFFVAESHDSGLRVAYDEEAARAGVEPVGCLFAAADVPLTVFVADDPERAWAEIGEYLLVDAAGYARWNAHRSGTASVSFASTVAELEREQGAYRIVTPEQARGYVSRGVPLGLQPLVGGLPPDLAWPYLEAAAGVATG